MTGAGRPPFDVVDVIRTKRDGHELTGEQIRWFIETYTAGGIAEEQCAALLMAIVWRGMTPEELSAWTAAMIATGERLDLSAVGRPTVDKHSTGGVGDKVSLPLVAMVAACGAAVPQLSGRGLGHTGGTLDKMESIPGWRAGLQPAEMIDVLRRVGGVICAAGPGLVPADRKLYALRDVTGTVESIPLIASSIMSKKIAEGTQALVLDVKVGIGAFMPDAGQARLLAETMVRLGEDNGVRTTALLTAMDTPLGRAAGNAIEVAEALDVLSGRGPEDLVTVTVALAREMLALAGVDADPDAARTDGRALATWRAMVSAQGGDPDAGLPAAADHRAVRARGRATSPASTPVPSAPPSGGSVPGGPGRRTRSAPPPGSGAGPNPASRSRQVNRCSNWPSTIPLGSTGPWPRRRERSRSARSRLRTRR